MEARHKVTAASFDLYLKHRRAFIGFYTVAVLRHNGHSSVNVETCKVINNQLGINGTLDVRPHDQYV